MKKKIIKKRKTAVRKMKAVQPNETHTSLQNRAEPKEFFVIRVRRAPFWRTEAFPLAVSRIVVTCGIAIFALALVSVTLTSFADTVAPDPSTGAVAGAVGTGGSVSTGGILGNLQKVGNGAYSVAAGTKGPGQIIAVIIQVILGIMGVVFVGMIMWGGFLWMTVGGEEKQIGKVHSLLFQAVIGLIIVLAAQFVTYWVLNTLSVSVIGP